LDPPTNFNFSGNDTTISVRWTPPTTLGSLCELQKYKITWNSSDNEETEEVPATDNSYEITNLTPCTTYDIKVSAENVAGSSSPGETSSATANVVLDPPAGLALNEEATKMTLSWTHPPAAGPNCNLQNYTVTWNSSNENGTAVVEATETSYEVTNLTPCTSYDVKIYAINAAGFSSFSEISGQTDPVVLDPPTNFKLLENDTTISVSWSSPTVPGSLCELLKYRITWNSSDNEQTAEVPATENSFVIADLIPCTLYDIKISAENVAGSSRPEKASRTTDNVVLEPPTSLKLNEETTKIKLSWIPPKPLGPFCELENYNVTWNSYTSKETAEVAATETSFDITQLTPCTTYGIKIFAVNVAGSSPFRETSGNTSLT
ncbi:hypothetical protein SK128_004925, partial [Halocaridina rubra]